MFFFITILDDNILSNQLNVRKLKKQQPTCLVLHHSIKIQVFERSMPL